MRVRVTVVALVSLVGSAASVFAGVTLVGKASIPGDARDKSGLSETLLGNIPHDRLGSFGSGIDFTGKDSTFVACDDRGPNNGESLWRCRTQTFRIDIQPGMPTPVRVDLLATTLLSDEQGRPLNGISTQLDAGDQGKGLRFDPESIRISPDGTWWMSDEYGPFIDEFSSEGKRIRRVDIPAKFRIAHAGATPASELPPNNATGRQSNRGLEGLAFSPDHTKLYAILQSPLIQDGALNAKNKRIGTNCRILEVTIATGHTREFVYPLESPEHGVNELLCLNDHELLVLERDGEAGEEAKFRKLFKADLSRASDVSAVEALPSQGVPEGVTPVSKEAWLDFLEPQFGLAGKDMPEKIEGLSFGPTLPDGRRTLVVTTDNDLIASQASWFWVFAFDLAPDSPAPSGTSLPPQARSPSR